MLGLDTPPELDIDEEIEFLQDIDAAVRRDPSVPDSEATFVAGGILALISAAISVL
jgi:hypothetical protein